MAPGAALPQVHFDLVIGDLIGDDLIGDSPLGLLGTVPFGLRDCPLFNEVYIGGLTLSANFPVKDALQPTRAGEFDGFVTRLTAAGTIDFSTYLGTVDTNVKSIALGAGQALKTNRRDTAYATLSRDIGAAGSGSRPGGSVTVFSLIAESFEPPLDVPFTAADAGDMPLNDPWTCLVSSESEDPTGGCTLPVGSVVFSINGARGIASQAGVLNSPETTASRLFAEVATDPLFRNTGIALVNRNATAATIRLTLTLSDGASRTATITLAANAHIGKFISELFPDLPSNFQGVLTISSTLRVAAVTLRLTINQRGEPILSVLPVVDLNSPPRGPLFLPHIVNGGGFTTQFIGVNTTNAPGNLTIDFFNDQGVRVLPPIR